MTTQADTLSDVRLVVEALDELDIDAIVALPIEAALVVYQILEQANRDLAGLRSQITQRIAVLMPEKQVTVDGAGTFVRHVKKDRTQWAKDDLLRAVLDSRIVDTETGEVKEETPLERVLHVYNLPAPRITALRERGIDADQYAHVESGGYQIEVLSNDS